FISGYNSSSNSSLTSTPTQAAISPLWDNWHTEMTAADKVVAKFYDDNNDTIADRLVVQWTDMQRVSSATPVTFQAVLYLNTGNNNGDILFNYFNTDTGATNT